MERPVEEAGALPDMTEEELAQRIAEAIRSPSGAVSEGDDSEDAPDWTGEREKKRLAKKPDTSHLRDALAVDPCTGQPTFLLEPGDRVVIERFASCLAKNPGDIGPWLDTREYVVRKVDHQTGRLDLYDDALKQSASSNFREGFAKGYRFLVPGGKLKRARGADLEHRAKPKQVASTSEEGEDSP